MLTFLGQDASALRPRAIKPEAMDWKDWKGRNISEVGAVVLTSGWSIPKVENVEKTYAAELEMLYRFYGPANEELYRLLDSLGPKAGWRGRFPSSAAEAAKRAAKRKGRRTHS